MSYWGFPPYVSVAEKRAKAAKKLEKLKKKNPNITPVVIAGKIISISWWGKAWNRNLESYADFDNRIGRGRSYVRNGAVLDLKINSGEVKALVQGSFSTPYSVTVKINRINKNVWSDIKCICEGKLDSLQELLMGRFPKSLDGIFTAKEKGLFPSPDEIEFDCSCPDFASMCKHIAATLYGIGARLDKDPHLFFTLRNADVNDLVTKAVEGKTKKLLKKADKKSGRVIIDSDLSSVFGIDLEGESPEDKSLTTSKTNKTKIKKLKPESASVKAASKSWPLKTKTVKK